MGVAFKRAGLGRRTQQFNPAAEGAKTMAQWLTAVMSMKGQGDMTVQDSIKLVHDTPPARRSEFAREIWKLRRQHGTDRLSEVQF